MRRRQLAVMAPLQALEEHDVLALAELAAEEDSERVRRLAFATPDSPVETVVGGRLLARGQLSADTGEELRQAVLARFSTEQLGRVTERVPPDAARRLATVMAALQPLDAVDEQLVGLVASELGVPVSEIRRWLGDLEAAGLLLTRGPLRRLTPDVLADQLLLEACVDQQWRPTGYADELWSRYGAAAAADLLANLAEVDTRLLARGTSTMEGVWSRLEEQFRGADAWGRELLLDIVARAAFWAPERGLRIARIAVADPARTSAWSLADVQIDDASVRERLPRVPRAAGQREDHVQAAAVDLAHERQSRGGRLAGGDPRRWLANAEVDHGGHDAPAESRAHEAGAGAAAAKAVTPADRDGSERARPGKDGVRAGGAGHAPQTEPAESEAVSGDRTRPPPGQSPPRARRPRRRGALSARPGAARPPAGRARS